MQPLIPISSFDELMARLPGLHPAQHHVLVNMDHPLIAGVLEQLLELVAGAQAGVFDFDGTLHPGNHWTEVRKLMLSEDAETDLREVLAYFDRPSRHDADDVAFILRSVDRLRKNRCSFLDLEAAARRIVPRAGAIPLMRSIGFERTAIVSYGLKDVIECWLKLATNHVFAEYGRAELFALELKWNIGASCISRLNTVVTDGNKGYCRRAFCGARGVPAEKTLVVADSPTDILMLGPDVVGCFLMPKIDPQIGRDKHRRDRMREMWDASACMVVSDDLTPLLEMRQK